MKECGHVMQGNVSSQLQNHTCTKHATKHMKSLKKIILIFISFSKHYKLSCKISLFPPLHIAGLLSAKALGRGGRFLQPAAVLPS